MRLPRALAYFNREVTNRVFSPLAGRVPPFAIVEHVGRRSGRRYRTVIWAFPHGPDLVVVLTYMIYRTRWGLSLRAVGENPSVAFSTGRNPVLIQYAAVFFGGQAAKRRH